MSGTTRKLVHLALIVALACCAGALGVYADDDPAAIARPLSSDRSAVCVEARPATTATSFGAYEYDGTGNVTKAGEDTFVYDRVGRIHEATIAGTTQTFTYDRHGNITNIATAGESGGGISIGSGNRLSNATYDASGNLRSYHGGTFVYDGLNVVTEAIPAGGNRHLYVYNAANERLATIEILPNGQRQSEWTLRDPEGRVLRRLVQHTNGAWSWKEDYIYRGSQLLAAEVSAPEKVRHFHLDHLGTPRLITGNGGAKLAERAYGAFGRGFPVSSSDLQEDLEFTGHERDNFQLDYMHARYYDPILGRFLSVDPTWESADLRKPQSWNRYSYVTNNPVNLTDPDGKVPIDPIELAKAAGATGIQFVADYVLPDGHSDHGTDADQPPRSQSELDQRVRDGRARTLQANKKAGDAFRDQLADALKAEGREVRTEQVKKTPFGPRRVDIEVAQDGQVTGAIETKVGHSRYTASQRAKDWWLRKVKDYIVVVVRKAL